MSAAVLNRGGVPLTHTEMHLFTYHHYPHLPHTHTHTYTHTYTHTHTHTHTHRLLFARDDSFARVGEGGPGYTISQVNDSFSENIFRLDHVTTCAHHITYPTHPSHIPHTHHISPTPHHISHTPITYPTHPSYPTLDLFVGTCKFLTTQAHLSLVPI